MEKEGDDNHILSAIEEHFPDFYQTAFTDDYGSTEQIMKETMEDDQNNLSIPVPPLASVTAAPDLILSPSSYDFISMILQEPLDQMAAADNNNSSEVTRKRSRSMPRNETQVQEHILSERKRREKLSRLFIALAAMVPGLKKTDKRSILIGATEHLKQLKLREALLSKEAIRNTNKSDKRKVRQTTNGHVLSWSSSCTSLDNVHIPQVDVKYEGKNVLIRINCQSRKKWIFDNLLHASETMGLTIENYCALPFENSCLVIAIVAKMNELFSSTRKELHTTLYGVICNLETRSE